MLPLEDVQASISHTLAHGPDHLEAGIFAGPVARILLALGAHANTVSHARLVALEDSFPLTRQSMGAEQFHSLSRAYLDQTRATIRPLTDIGTCFATFMASRDVGHTLVDLARAEWTWLLTHRAAEARPFVMGDIAGAPEHRLLETPIHVHPAAHLLSLTEPADAAFRALGDVCGGRMLLFTRPTADIFVTAIDPPGCALFERAKAMTVHRSTTIGTLLAALLEEGSDDDAASAFLSLATAGAFAHSEEPRS